MQAPWNDSYQNNEIGELGRKKVHNSVEWISPINSLSLKFMHLLKLLQYSHMLTTMMLTAKNLVDVI